MELKLRVEYKPRLVRNASIQCPTCKAWFKAQSITDDPLESEFDLIYSTYTCPTCGEFSPRQKGYTLDIEESSESSKVYRGVLNY